MNDTPEPRPEDMTETTPLITPARPVPAEETPAEAPLSDETMANEETPVEAAEPAETAEQAESEEAPAAAEEPASEAADTAPSAAPKKDRSGLVLDCLLVLLLAGALGGGAWYLNRELAQYRVPSPMEMAAQENIELCKEREELQEKAYHADEQLHLRKRLSNLAMRSSELQRRIEEKKQIIETQHRKVLAVQHDIRQEDKSLRSVAKGLLPGMSIGTATTTSGRTYHNAVIRRLEGGRITLRMPEGQTTFPVNQLVKDTLPDLARYAFGQADMVDMSDFEVTPDQPKPKARKGKLITTKAAEQTADTAPKDYEPAAGAPVVDTDANKTSTWTGEGDDSPEDTAAGSWQPPSGDLPF